MNEDWNLKDSLPHNELHLGKDYNVVDFSTLQHERGHNRPKFWIDHWHTIKEERTKLNFLMMLKGRRDMHGDKDADGTLNYLVEQWLHEQYIS